MRRCSMPAHRPAFRRRTVLRTSGPRGTRLLGAVLLGFGVLVGLPGATSSVMAAPTADAPPRKGGTSDRAQKQAQQKAEAQRRARAEAQQRARAEAQRRAQAEAQRRARAEAQRRAQAEAQRRARAEAQRRAQAEAQQRARAEAQRRAQAEAQRRAQADAQRRAQAEAQRRAQLDAQRRAQAEAQRRAQLDAQRRAQTEAQRRSQLDAQRRAQSEAQRRAQLEAQRRAQSGAQLREQDTTRDRTASDLRRRALEAARRRAATDSGTGTGTIRRDQDQRGRTEDDLFRRRPTIDAPSRRSPVTVRPGDADRRSPATVQREALLARRAELNRREQERRQWILEEQARIARERAALRPRQAPSIQVGPSIGDTVTVRPDGKRAVAGRGGGIAGTRPGDDRIAPPRGVVPFVDRTVPPLLAPGPTSFAAVREAPVAPRVSEDPFIPVDPPSYGDPVTYVPSGSPVFIDDAHEVHADVHVWAPTVNFISHDHWPSHYGYWSWVHPGHLGWATPVHHGWDIGWSWNIAFGFGHDDWWFGFRSGRRCFPYVPYVAARRGWGHGSHFRWWHHGYDPFPFHHRSSFGHWYRPHVAWYRDVCRPRTETVYLTVERVVAPPPPPSLGEAWDAFEIGRIGRAADLFDLILDARPGDEEARLGLALARARLGDIALAAADLRRALEIRPDALDFVPAGPGLTAELGLARTRLRDRLRIDPEDLDALLGLSVVLDLLGEPAAAYHAADRAIDLGEVSTAGFLIRERLDQQLLFGGGRTP